MHPIIELFLSLACSLAPGVEPLPAGGPPSLLPAAAVAGTALAGSALAKDWIAKSSDNVCGLRDVGQVSNPAVIDWQACLDATPEMKKVKQDKIDLNTPEGIRLLNAGTNRVTSACETVRSANGYCSVWKAIRHKDQRTVPDISELVKAQY
jgi:hypothetical protein